MRIIPDHNKTADPEELGEQFRKIGKVFDVSWVSSSQDS